MATEKLTKIEDGVWQTPDGRFRVEAADNVRLYGYTLIDTQRWTWGYVGPRLPYGPRNVDLNPDTLAEARELIAKRRDCAEDDWGGYSSPELAQAAHRAVEAKREAEAARWEAIHKAERERIEVPTREAVIVVEYPLGGPVVGTVNIDSEGERGGHITERRLVSGLSVAEARALGNALISAAAGAALAQIEARDEVTA